MSYYRQSLSQEEIDLILQTQSWGILSLIDEKNQPYGVPVNYVYRPEKKILLIHSAKGGRKIRAIKHNPSAHFTVIGYCQLMPQYFVSHYDAVMLEGQIQFLDKEEDKRDALLALCDTLAPEETERRQTVIEKELAIVAILRFDIEKATGKRNRDEYGLENS